MLILMLTTSEAHAQHNKMSTEELTVESTTVMYGKCSSIKSSWNQEMDIIFTEITIIPEGYIKGNLGAETVITVPGGRVGDIIYEVSEMPVFEAGEEVFAFIYKHPSGKNLVTGGFQGKIRIEKDPETGKRMINSLPSQGEVRSDNLKSMAAKPAASTKDVTLLEDFIKEVEGYLK
jgi:hypothetical protein